MVSLGRQRREIKKPGEFLSTGGFSNDNEELLLRRLQTQAAVQTELFLGVLKDKAFSATVPWEGGLHTLRRELLLFPFSEIRSHYIALVDWNSVCRQD